MMLFQGRIHKIVFSEIDLKTAFILLQTLVFCCSVKLVYSFLRRNLIHSEMGIGTEVFQGNLGLQDAIKMQLECNENGKTGQEKENTTY